MKILVMSSDNEQDTFELFHYCMEKNWPNHPEVIYSTETVDNPYYKTIKKDYPLEVWSRRIRETIEEIDDDKIFLICDDIFIRKPIDNDYINEIAEWITTDLVCLHFEANCTKDNELFNNDWLYCRDWIRRSIMASMWNKEALMVRFNADLDPWTLEDLDNTGNKIHLVRNTTDLFDWGKRGLGWQNWGIFRGKWSTETIEYAKSNNIELDLSRGIQETMPEHDSKEWIRKREHLRGLRKLRWR